MVLLMSIWVLFNFSVFDAIYKRQRRTSSTCRSGQVTFLPLLWY